MTEVKNKEVKNKIEQLLKDNPVMLFMKGSPEAPQCGFSAKVSEILQFLEVSFHSFDVLTDESIRNGIKEYANWPTIPQLYINGIFMGGCDIVQEDFQDGNLEKSLKPFIKPQNKNNTKHSCCHE